MLSRWRIGGAVLAVIFWISFCLQALYGCYLLMFVAEGQFERMAATGAVGGSLYLARIALDFGKQMTLPGATHGWRR